MDKKFCFLKTVWFINIDIKDNKKRIKHLETCCYMKKKWLMVSIPAHP